MRVLSEILDSSPMGYYLSFHIVYRIGKVSVYANFVISQWNYVIFGALQNYVFSTQESSKFFDYV